MFSVYLLWTDYTDFLLDFASNLLTGNYTYLLKISMKGLAGLHFQKCFEGFVAEFLFFISFLHFWFL